MNGKLQVEQNLSVEGINKKDRINCEYVRRSLKVASLKYKMKENKSRRFGHPKEGI